MFKTTIPDLGTMPIVSVNGKRGAVEIDRVPVAGRGHFDPSDQSDHGFDYRDENGRCWNIDPAGEPDEIMKAAFEAAGVDPQACAYDVYGDEKSDHTIIVRMENHKVVFSCTGGKKTVSVRRIK